MSEYVAPAKVRTLHEYWQAPDKHNRPEGYLTGADARSRMLSWLVGSVVSDPEAAVLEIGCNAGRNLVELFQRGYRNLHGIEINEAALAMFRERFPEVTEATSLYPGPVEAVITGLADDRFDLVYTMGVLQHVHHESDWVLAEIARVARLAVVTVEDEEHEAQRHFARDYGDAFTNLGLTQIMWVDCQYDVTLKRNDFRGVKARLFLTEEGRQR